jgi:type II secretory pathway component GspD/PulD (secretin)
MKTLAKFTAAAVCAVSVINAVSAADATADYDDTEVNVKLNIMVKDDTDVLHFVRDNSDPDVVTKPYILKHADPYEIRSYLREMVQSRKIDDSNTGIQAIKYNDGAGIIMVSAEDYRFEDTEDGQGIDSIIEMLDKPGVASVPGTAIYVYQPKYRSAEELRDMIEAAGANVADDETENIGGSDLIRCDTGLNLLVFNTTQFSRKNIDTVLKEYDCPYPEVRAKITVYELYAENDAKLGIDFQAWKNNDGIDLFSTGGRFMKNFTSDGVNLVRKGGWSDTQYFNFNPKWNTKYIDFLTSKGKGKVLHTCEVALLNGATTEIERTNQVFLAGQEPAETPEYIEEYIHLENATPDEDFSLSGYTKNGRVIGISASGAVTLDIVHLSSPTGTNAERYSMRVKGGEFTINGKNAGRKVSAKFVEVLDGNGDEIEFESNNVPAYKGNIVTTDASDEFGFKLSLTPSISAKATMLDVNVSNSSLIGYTSEGAPRIQQGAEVASSFMISNEGTKLVIGGIEKRDVVSVSGGIPLLKDLPILGWVFSTESESTKRSQLVVVAEVVPVRPEEAAMTEAETKSTDKIKSDLEGAGEWNTWGFHQFLLDSDR